MNFSVEWIESLGIFTEWKILSKHTAAKNTLVMIKSRKATATSFFIIFITGMTCSTILLVRDWFYLHVEIHTRRYQIVDKNFYQKNNVRRVILKIYIGLNCFSSSKYYPEVYCITILLYIRGRNKWPYVKFKITTGSVCMYVLTTNNTSSNRACDKDNRIRKTAVTVIDWKLKLKQKHLFRRRRIVTGSLWCFMEISDLINFIFK